MNKSLISLALLVLVASLALVQCDDMIVMGHGTGEGDVIKHEGKKGDLIITGHHGGGKGYGKKKKGSYIKHEGKGDLIMN